MAGIYIHIPFCKQKCHYCDFHFSTSLKLKEDLLVCLLREIELQKEYLDEVVETIYFGGGTPSYLEFEELKQILDKIRETFTISDDAEITLEGNPDDLSKEKIEELVQLGVKRLSIGIQSFRNEDLEWMNRAHNQQQAEECVRNAQELGIDNITIDLIYGLPELSNEQWMQNIQKALALNVPHISAYNLTVEEGTALHHFVKTGKSRPVSDEKGAQQFEMLNKELKANGYIQYEISNYGKEGYFSQHNTSYWLGKKYLGLGPSAHSFNGVSRQWNIANNRRYIDQIKEGQLPFEVEELSLDDRYNEYILTGLRTIWGCNFEHIQKEFGGEYLNYLKEGLIQFKDYIIPSENEVILNQKGRLLADGIASDLFR